MRRRLLAAIALGALTVAAGMMPASADMAQPAVVSADPVDYTPHIKDGTVWSAVVVGDTAVVSGNFTSVTDSAGRRTYPRRHIFAFGLRDGVVRDFAPEVDGPVYAVAAGADGSIYLGGAFKTVNGTATRGLGKVSLATGRNVAGFRAAINWGDVRTLGLAGGRLYAGGTFSAINGVPRTALARMNPATGTVDAGFDAKLSAPGKERTRVEHFDISPDGRKMVAVGVILRAGVKDRAQLVMLDIAGSSAVVSDWYTDSFKPACRDGFQTYMRQVKFSPDGSYFVVVTTGRENHRQKLCDTASRWETGGTGRHLPTWRNHTGGDSLYAVAVTGSAVYVGGHQRWMNNPDGHESAGPGAVKREGIAALDTRTGRALPFNPGRDRGVGVRSFVSTSAGLLVGSDTTRIGGEYHGRISLLPRR
ncbi:delta-60 repeat domain-containing protein [Catenuloplanes japonicus]|uniref:delta-60 repeat domain-containing protein n=1 Tax=Catenuloplanes japonicus TaxID=33876 RepID=UPI000526B470|nr:delta-60 repeat domain-containing protein [Catenuloplanes japonicus]